VFENGRIVETGTFDELVATGGRFAALAKAQFMTTEGKAVGGKVLEFQPVAV
jgi:ATP-binding cassette subfamily B protein